MAKPDPTTGTRPIARQTTVEWECPFCGNANGIPEITVCACGAASDGSTATAASGPYYPDLRPAAADKHTAATGDDSPATPAK